MWPKRSTPHLGRDKGVIPKSGLFTYTSSISKFSRISRNGQNLLVSPPPHGHFLEYPYNQSLQPLEDGLF